jgi:hypothetical protein
VAEVGVQTKLSKWLDEREMETYGNCGYDE